MYLTTKAITKKHKMYLSNIENFMSRNTNLYSVALHNLCELGFSPSPFCYNDIDVKQAIIEEFPSEIKYLRKSLHAGVSFSTETVRYASKASKNSEFREVMSVYATLLKSGQALRDCESLLDEVKFRKNGTADINLRVVVSNGVEKKTQLPLYPELLFEKGYGKIKKVNIMECVSHKICTVIGISDTIFERYKESNKSMFIEGVSFEDELSFMDSILKGNLPLNGKYGKLLIDDMLNYYKVNNSTFGESSTGVLPYDASIYNSVVHERVSMLNEVRDEVYRKGGTELYLDNTYIYYQFPVDSDDWEVPNVINVGCYTNLDGLVEVFDGLQGFFTADKTGMPAYIKDYGLVYLYPEIEYSEITFDALYEEYNCKNETELLSLISKFSKNTLVQELTLALLKSKCGVNQYRFMNSYEGVNRIEYEACCKEALYLVKDTFNLL